MPGFLKYACIVVVLVLVVWLTAEPSPTDLFLVTIIASFLTFMVWVVIAARGRKSDAAPIARPLPHHLDADLDAPEDPTLDD